jgi:hypothetical protein
MTKPSKAYAVLWNAVRTRAQVAFTYGQKTRAAYPLILGYASDGREALMAYQFGGQTSPGKTLPAWRCFFVADVHDVSMRKEGWLEGESHKQPQTCVQYVDVDANIPETLTRQQPLRFGSPELRTPRRSG